MTATHNAVARTDPLPDKEMGRMGKIVNSTFVSLDGVINHMNRWHFDFVDTESAGTAAPIRLVYDDLVATAISRSDLADDVRGINASLALIKQTRGGKWPTGPVSEDSNIQIPLTG